MMLIPGRRRGGRGGVGVLGWPEEAALWPPSFGEEKVDVRELPAGQAYLAPCSLPGPGDNPAPRRWTTPRPAVSRSSPTAAAGAWGAPARRWRTGPPRRPTEAAFLGRDAAGGTGSAWAEGNRSAWAEGSRSAGCGRPSRGRTGTPRRKYCSNKMLSMKLINAISLATLRRFRRPVRLKTKSQREAGISVGFSVGQPRPASLAPRFSY